MHARARMCVCVGGGVGYFKRGQIVVTVGVTVQRLYGLLCQ